MKAKDSYLQYQAFVNKNFPNSYYRNVPDSITERFFMLVHGRNIYLDVVLRNFPLNSNQSQFIEIFNFNLNRLLYTIPTNDDYIINYNFRSLIESLINIVYFGKAAPDDKNYNESYRNLKKKLKETEYYSTVKNDCDQLFNFYSVFSEELHQKKGVSDYSKSFLEDIMSLPSKTSLIKRISQLEKIINFLEKVIFSFSSVKLQNLSGPDRFLLRNELGRRWFDKYFT